MIFSSSFFFLFFLNFLPSSFLSFLLASHFPPPSFLSSFVLSFLSFVLSFVLSIVCPFFFLSFFHSFFLSFSFSFFHFFFLLPSHLPHPSYLLSFLLSFSHSHSLSLTRPYTTTHTSPTLPNSATFRKTTKVRKQTHHLLALSCLFDVLTFIYLAVCLLRRMAGPITGFFFSLHCEGRRPSLVQCQRHR